MKNSTKTKRERRIHRSRARIVGTAKRPRLSVFRSNRHMYVQLIDDAAGKTLVSASTKELGDEKGNKTEQSSAIGALLAKKAKDAGIDSIVFDRRFYKYHGRVKAVAEAVRAGGLKL